ncbi:MAG: two pore domain potassium channel family protein [bacterium]|nr:two pore domain potassium channel family protein [bacterium]
MINNEIGIILIIVLITLAIGSTFYHTVEGWSWLDSVYFSAITLTTVGYGDISPTTDVSKMFTIVYLFIGISILLSFINIIANKTIKARLEKHKWRK